MMSNDDATEPMRQSSAKASQQPRPILIANRRRPQSPAASLINRPPTPASSSLAKDSSTVTVASLTASHQQQHRNLLQNSTRNIAKPFTVASSLSMTNSVRSRAVISHDLSIAQMELDAVRVLLRACRHELSTTFASNGMSELRALQQRWEWEMHKLTMEMNDLRGDSSMVALLPPSAHPHYEDGAAPQDGEDRNGSSIKLTAVSSTSFVSSVNSDPAATSVNPPSSIGPSKSMMSALSRSSLMAHIDHDLKRMGITRPLPIVRELPLAVIRRLKLHARAAKQRLREQRAVDWHIARLRKRVGSEMFVAGKKYLRAAALHRKMLLRQWLAVWRTNVSASLLRSARGHAHLRSVKRCVLLHRVFAAWRLSSNITITLLALERQALLHLPAQPSSLEADLLSTPTTARVVEEDGSPLQLESPSASPKNSSSSSHHLASSLDSLSLKAERVRLSALTRVQLPIACPRPPPTPPSPFTSESRHQRSIRLHALNELVVSMAREHAHAAVFSSSRLSSHPAEERPTTTPAAATSIRFDDDHLPCLVKSVLSLFLEEELARLLFWRLIMVKAFAAWRVNYVHNIRRVKVRKSETADDFFCVKLSRGVLLCWKYARIVHHLRTARHAKYMEKTFVAWRVCTQKQRRERHHLQQFIAGSESRCRRLLFGRWCRLMPTVEQRGQRSVAEVQHIVKNLKITSYWALYSILSTWMITNEVEEVMMTSPYISMSSVTARPPTKMPATASTALQLQSPLVVSQRSRLFGTVLGPIWESFIKAEGDSHHSLEGAEEEEGEQERCDNNGNAHQRPPIKRTRALEICTVLSRHPQLIGQLSLDTQWLQTRVTMVTCFKKWRVHTRFHRGFDALMTMTTATEVTSTIPSRRHSTLGELKSVLASATYLALDQQHFGRFVDPTWWAVAKQESDNLLKQRRSSAYAMRRSSSAVGSSVSAAFSPPMEEDLEASLQLPPCGADIDDDTGDGSDDPVSIEVVAALRREQFRKSSQKLSLLLLRTSPPPSSSIAADSSSSSSLICPITQLAMLLTPQPLLVTSNSPSEPASLASSMLVDNHGSRVNSFSRDTGGSGEVQHRSVSSVATAAAAAIDMYHLFLVNPALCALMEACKSDVRTSSTAARGGRSDDMAPTTSQSWWWTTATIQSIHAWVATLEQRFSGVLSTTTSRRRIRNIATADGQNASVALEDSAAGRSSSDEDEGPASNQLPFVIDASGDQPPAPLTRGELLALQRLSDIRKIGSLNCRSAAASYASEPRTLLGFLGSEVTINVYDMFMKKKKKKRRKGKSASPAKKKTVSATSGGEKVPLSPSQVQGSLSPPPPTSSSSSYFTSGVNTMPVLSAAARSPPVAAFTPLLPTTATRFENLSSPTSLQAAKKNSSVVVKGGSDALYGDVIAVSVLGSTAAKTLLRVPSDEALLTLGNNNNNNHQSNISPFSADPSPVPPPYMANDGLQFATTTSPSRSPDVDRRLIEEAAALVRSGMLEEEQQRTARSGKNTPAGGNSLSITPSGLVALPQPTTVALQQSDAPSGKHSASLPVTVASADAYVQQQRSPICDILTFPPNQSFLTVVTAPDDTAVASHFWTDDSMRDVQVPWVHLSPSLPEMEALLPLPPPYMPRLDAFEIPVQMPSTQTTGRRHTTSSATSLSHFKQNSLDRRESSSVMSTVRQRPSFSVDANERDDEGDDDVAKYLPNSLRSLQLFSWDRGVAFHKQHENLQDKSSSMRPAGRVLSTGPRQPLRRPTSAQEVRRSGSVTEPSVAHDASYGRAPHAETLFGAREFSSSLPTVGFPAQALRKQHKKTRVTKE